MSAIRERMYEIAAEGGDPFEAFEGATESELDEFDAEQASAAPAPTTADPAPTDEVEGGKL